MGSRNSFDGLSPPVYPETNSNGYWPHHGGRVAPPPPDNNSSELGPLPALPVLSPLVPPVHVPPPPSTLMPLPPPPSVLSLVLPPPVPSLGPAPLILPVTGIHSDVIAPRLAPSEDEKSESDEASDGGGDRPLYLDTRLQMLMKVKSANMPAFLMRSDSSDDEQKAAAARLKTVAAVPPPPPEGPLSRSPSPFLSRESYLASFQLTGQQEELERVNLELASLPPVHSLHPPLDFPPLPNEGLFTSGGFQSGFRIRIRIGSSFL